MIAWLKRLFGMNEPLVGYMCRTKFECDLEDGAWVYTDLDDCLENCRCARGCGVVEVEVRFRKVALPGSNE